MDRRHGFRHARKSRTTGLSQEPYNWTDVIPPGQSVDTYTTGSAVSGPSDWSSDGGLDCDASNLGVKGLAVLRYRHPSRYEEPHGPMSGMYC